MAELLPGSLSIVRPAASGVTPAFETFISISFNGHVDLGTGIRTALGQIVAEELDVSFARVVVVLGDTSRVPNQGATIASETIQITAVPLRKAAAQARHFLLARAAERLELPIGELTTDDGLIRGRDNRTISYGELIAGETIRLELVDDVAVKAVDAYTIVGQSVPRVDIPAKATGELVYVHDVRLPGMLHGRVVRPPYAGVDAGPFVGTSLIAVDKASVRDIPGLVSVVQIGDFVGVVAEREENAIKAAAQLKVSWKPTPTLPDLKDIETALRANPSAPRVLIDKGDVDAALASAAKPMQRTYIWPYQMHGSIGPSCALAQWQDGRLTVWTHSQGVFPLRAELVKELMAARRVRDRARVQDAKVALGERGEKWWKEVSVEGRCDRLLAAIRALLRARPSTASICPSDAARIAGGAHWRALLPHAREVARSAARTGEIIVTQRGKKLTLNADWRGPIRIRLPS